MCKYIAEAYKCFQSLGSGTWTCRISDNDYIRLFKAIEKIGNRNVIDFFFAFFKQPYETEDNEKKLESFLLDEFTYHGERCAGLAYASIINCPSLSLCVGQWKEPIITIRKNNQKEEVINVSNVESNQTLIGWYETVKPVELIQSDLRIDEKKNNIKIRADHGQDVLQEHAERLIHNEYVTAVRSQSYHPHRRSYINKINPDGTIVIVLPWTSQGLSLLVTTTGRNYRETEAIAEMLRDRYGKR